LSISCRVVENNNNIIIIIIIITILTILAINNILAFEKEIARHQAALQNALHSSMTTN